MVKEECICPDISTEDPIGSDQCKCPGDLVLVNRMCECPDGSEKDNNDPTLCNEGTLWHLTLDIAKNDQIWLWLNYS